MSLHLSARLLALLSILAMVVGVGRAQVPVGSINGIVTDPGDAVVAGAHVTALSADHGISHDSVTNSSGLYTLSDLPPGTYDLRIAQPGFAVSEFKSIVLEAGRNTTIDARLQIAQAAQR